MQARPATVWRSFNVGSKMSDLTSVQQGLLGENEFWKIVVVESGGRIEPRRPMPDDERIDFVIHPRRAIEPVLAFQVKTALKLRVQGKERLLAIYFTVDKRRLFTHPRYWYFFGHFDQEQMGFGDPVFLAPSSFVHGLGFDVGTKSLGFMLAPSMDARSRDKWGPYRTQLKNVATRIGAMMREAPKQSREDRLQWNTLVGRAATLRTMRPHSRH